MKSCSNPTSKIVTQDKVKELLQVIDRNRLKEDGCFNEQDSSGFFQRSGLSYPTFGAPITIVCETVSETYYYDSGLFYRTSRVAFLDLVRGLRPIGGEYALSIYNKRRLRQVEVEFVLGILSAIDPLSGWEFFKDDLPQFVINSRKNLNKWSVELATLLLTQQMLKKYAKWLHLKICSVITDHAWSSLHSAPTDDATIARTAGYLLGAYRSEELMNKMIMAHRAISFQILKRFSAVSRHQLKAERKAGWHLRQVEILGRSFGKVGVKVSHNEVRLYLGEIKTASDAVQEIVQILGGAVRGKRRVQHKRNHAGRKGDAE